MAKGGVVRIPAAKCVLRSAEVLLGALFVFTGALKLRDPQAFLAAIQSFQILPEILAFPAAFFFPWLEIWAGAALASGKFRVGAPAVIVILLVVFLVAIGSAWGRGLDINCGCFGDLFPKNTTHAKMILRNLVLLSAAVSILAVQMRRPRLPGGSPPANEDSSNENSP
jgi:uncharacterized membrane protein YphA (DoxX/SURF4 family)